ncbi:hypothetical protein HGB13_00585 [bacterium]|nr:hypothetical protein [bacterium]
MDSLIPKIDTGLDTSLSGKLRESMGLGAAKKPRKTVDLSNSQDLIDYAAKKGVTSDVNKPTFFRRALDVMSRGNYMSANLAKDIADGGEFKPLQSAWRGLSGQDKTTYADVLATAGVDNKILRGGLGFVLDVALDPTTYFGGTLIKGAGKVAGIAAKPVGQAIQKSSPIFANHIIDASKSLKDAFGTAFKFGYNVTPEVSNAVTTSLNKIGMAKDDIINKYVKVFEPLDKIQQKAFARTLIQTRKDIRAYEVKRVAELEKTGLKTEEALSLARKEANDKIKPKFGDATQQEVFDKRLVPEIDNLAKTAGLDDAFRVDAYYPIMDIDKMDKASKLGRVLAQGNKSYLNEFKDAQKDVAKLLDKPIEAYTRVEMAAMRDAINKETLKSAVGTYGKSVKDFNALSDAEKLLYKEIKDKKLGGKTVGYLKSADAEFINDYMFPEFKTLDLLAQASGYDKMTRIFKTAVTSWFPAFHARNFISGVAQNYSVFGKEGLNPTNYITAAGIAKGTDLPLVIKNWRGKVMFDGTGKELKQAIKERFGGSSRYVSDLGDYIEDIGGGKFQWKKITDPGRRLGNAIETYHKMAATVMGLKQGKGLEEAMNLAEKAGFDYSKITKFESKIMRRAIPFYTFMRKNAGLQLDTLVHHPERILNQAKLANGLSEMLGGKVTDEDVKGLPDWVLGGLGFKLNDGQYLSQFGLPIEEFIATMNEPLMKTLTSLNPVVKYPLESKLGYDFFRQQEIVDIDNIAPATGKVLYDLDQKGQLPQWLSDSMNVKKVMYKGKETYTAAPAALHVLRNLPTSRAQAVFEKIFDKDTKAANKWTAFFSGAKIYDIDLEKQAYFKEKDLKNDIQKQLLELGEGKQFKTFYIYK